ncbi:MAG: hypothetical protein FWF24_07410 [Alphaproteobacteria bacterium]|nr:hypothetical protein [Alphaproteobacteria bacterium]
MILGALTNYANPIEVGASYRRTGAHALVETAYVLDVAKDKLGIPHVHFQLHIVRGACRPTVETRTLSLEAFQSRFKDRIRETH